MFSFKVSSAAVATFAVCALAAAGPASAQAWIGQVAGNMAAQQAAAAAEAACQAGTPAAPKDIERANADVGPLLAAYFDLDASAKPAALKKVFALKAEGGGYADVNGPAKFDALGARLDAPTPTLNRLSFIVGGDAMSARGVWEAKAGDTVVGYYAIDFLATGVWNPGWRIMRMTVFPADRQPTAPGAYCHHYQTTSWSLEDDAAG